MSTKSRKEREKENRREDILKAAEAIMSVNGLHGLSIDLIAQETELAKGTIYLYFKSKEEILSILTIKARKSLLIEFQEFEQKEENPIEKLKAIVKANYSLYKKNPLYYDLLSLYEANNKLKETDEMYQTSDDLTKMVANIAIKAQEQGLMNPNINPLHFTMILWGMSVGMLQLMKVRGAIMKDKMDIVEEDLLNTYIEIFENGIKK
jgi:TetR/AcrR family transcriptional regulator